jgi:hypothetical protein
MTAAIVEMKLDEYKRREDELLALRARVAKLEAALLNCKQAAEDYNDGSIPHFVETALKDNPQ